MVPNGYWQNPSIYGSVGLGWPDFLSHDYLFFNQSNIDGWQYIYEDSIKFSLRYKISTEALESKYMNYVG